MPPRKHGQKGYEFEEILRAYFLRAGFFVLRGLPLQFEGDDATDVDLWLYERPTGSARRRQIIDAKFKQKPKATERLFWTKGLATMLEVDGAYVATTDTRSSLRSIAKKLGLHLIDGRDLDRINQNKQVLYSDRLTEEELQNLIKSVDKSRRTKDTFDNYNELKGYVATHFGAPLINIALDSFALSARNCLTAHKDSAAAKVNGRLAYLSASLTAAALDFVGVEDPFKSASERGEIFLNAVRFGFTNREVGTEKIRLAAALIRKYAKNGSAVATLVENKVMEDYNRIPAEIIAEQSLKMSLSGELFQCARAMEHWAYSKALPNYDDIEAREKSFIGALLDFSDVDRAGFAASWRSEIVGEYVKGFAERQADFLSTQMTNSYDISSSENIGPLFDRDIISSNAEKNNNKD